MASSDSFLGEVRCKLIKKKADGGRQVLPINDSDADGNWDLRIGKEADYAVRPGPGMQGIGQRHAQAGLYHEVGGLV